MRSLKEAALLELNLPDPAETWDEVDVARDLAARNGPTRRHIVSSDPVPEPVAQVRFSVCDPQRFRRALPREVWVNVQSAENADAPLRKHTFVSLALPRGKPWRIRVGLAVLRLAFGLVNLAVPLVTRDKP